MKPHERQAQMEQIVRQTGEVSVEILARRFDVSTETVRRDLSQLAEEGRVLKVHGGAKRPRLIVEGTFDVRNNRASDAKCSIGERAAVAVEPGEVLFVDTGSTTLAAAEPLAAITGLTIITNSWRFADRLAQAGSDATIHLLGGTYYSDNAETIGPQTLAQIGNYQADRAILTVAAISPSIGAMDASFEEAAIARAMAANSRNVIVLADSGKFGQRAAHLVCRSDEISLLISDQQLDPAHREAMTAMGVEIWT